MSKKPDNQTTCRWYARTMTVVMVVFISLLLGGVIYRGSNKREQKQKAKARQEQRGKDFADYIICNVRNSVQENINDTDITNAANEYARDSMAYSAHFAQLVKDSTKYANAVYRDAIMINNLDKSQKKQVSFEEALEYVNAQPATYRVKKTKTYIHTDYDGFGEVTVWTEYIPTDEVIIETNNSPARIIKINKRHLTRISLDLATRRSGMQR